MALVAVALNGNVLGAVESLVGATAVVSLAILVGGALVASNGPAATYGQGEQQERTTEQDIHFLLKTVLCALFNLNKIELKQENK